MCCGGWGGEKEGTKKKSLFYKIKQLFFRRLVCSIGPPSILNVFCIRKITAKSPHMSVKPFQASQGNRRAGEELQKNARRTIDTRQACRYLQERHTHKKHYQQNKKKRGRGKRLVRYPPESQHLLHSSLQGKEVLETEK